MGYYKDNLKKFEETGLRVWEILCSKEVDVRLPSLPDEQFEAVVEFVYDWVMNSDMMPADLMGLIATGLADNDFTLADFDNYDGQVKITDSLYKKI